MDFELTDEQRLFRETLRDFAGREIVPVARELERSGTYPDKIAERLAELGLFGLNVPEEYGAPASTGSPTRSPSRRSPVPGWARPACSDPFRRLLARRP